MHGFVIALIGGLAGTVLTLLATAAAALYHARGEVAAHDRTIVEHDEDLASWISDDDLRLRRDLDAKSEALSKENLFYSGHHAKQLALLKEAALHRFRDQARAKLRARAALEASEDWRHAFWRRRGLAFWLPRRPVPALTSPERAASLLDAWRAEVTRNGDPPLPVVDPTRRDLGDALKSLEAEGLGGYGSSSLRQADAGRMVDGAAGREKA